MTFWLGLGIGFFLGGTFGFIGVAILTASSSSLEPRITVEDVDLEELRVLARLARERRSTTGQA